MAEVTAARKQEAKAIFDSLVKHLHDIHLNFSTEQVDDRYLVRFNMSGDDIPMRFFLYVNPRHQIITMHSPQPVRFKPEQYGEACQALCAINYRLVDGDFQLDLNDGEVLFNMSNCYAGSLISDEVFDYMVGMSVNIVDEFNDKLLLLSKGLIDLNSFLQGMNYNV